MTDPDITLYDKYDYDYTSYWKNRSYEHEAEAMAISRIFSSHAGSWCVDIGGSFGRHVPQYYQRFHNCVIADYSIKALVQAREEMKKRGITNVHVVAANAYHLPFREDVFDAGLMIRVMHHLEKPEEVIEEISRILAPDSVFVLEAANKIHLKSLIRAFLTFKWSYPFSTEPVDVSSGGKEGSGNGESGIMKNYHPKYVKNLLVSHETALRRTLGISFFRIPFLKRVVPHSLLVRAESVFQRLFGWLPFTPSILFEIYSIKEPSPASAMKFSSLNDILVCPKCKGPLDHRAGKYKCASCSLNFSKTEGVLDLRYPVITE